MTSPKVAKWLIAGLLLTNVLLVALLVIGRPGEPAGRSGPRDIIIERLRFSESQIAEYDKLIETHRPAVRAIRTDVQALRGQLYEGLNSPEDATRFNSITTLIGRKLAALDSLNFRHLQDVRALTTPEQAVAFGRLSEDVGGLFGVGAPSPDTQ